MFDASFGPYTLSVGRVHEKQYSPPVTTWCVKREGHPTVGLTHFETIILWCLAREPGAVVHRDEIFKVMYADRVPPSSNGIEVLIRRIRRKLDPVGDLKLIKTVRGRGYQLRNNWQEVKIPHEEKAA